MIYVNWIGVIVAGVVGMVVGALWYGPLFGKLWARLVGMTQEKMEEAKQKGMAKSYVIAFIGQLVTAYVLAYLIALTGSYSINVLVPLVFWIWLGLIMPIMIGGSLWEGKPWKLVLLNGAYYIVVLMAMSFVLLYLK